MIMHVNTKLKFFVEIYHYLEYHKLNFLKIPVCIDTLELMRHLNQFCPFGRSISQYRQIQHDLKEM